MACGICMGINSHRCPSCGKPIKVTVCERCHGTGKVHVAYHTLTLIEWEVTRKHFYSLPKDEDEAVEQGYKWFQGDSYRCSDCGGEGYVIEEDEDED